jgi:hypothetical protein
MTMSPFGSSSNPLVDDIIADILGEQPGLALQGNASQMGRGRNFERFFEQNQARLLRQFETAVGGQLAQGQLPTLTAQSFFNPQFLLESYFGTSPQDRGQGTSQFAPRTAFRF